LIRQAISCDVCGADMQQSHHWFVAYNHAEELRVTRWSARIRSRAGVKHLCGQTCLHKLVDEFLARTLAGRASTSVQPEGPRHELTRSPRTGANLLAPTAHLVPSRQAATICEPYLDEFESSARLISSRDSAETSPPLPLPSSPSPLNDRSAAWKREQARIQAESRSQLSRARSIA
jgi:hypothetical protein